MPAPKSTPSSGGSGRSKKSTSGATPPPAKRAPQSGDRAAGASNPRDLVMLTRDRIQDTLDDFAERGRVTRDDANELVAELLRRGREQTEDILSELERLVDRGRDQLETATKRARRVEPVDRLVRSADRARRTVGVGPAFPILGYDDLSTGQVRDRLQGLSPPELRKVRDYERRHANRKTVLEAIENALG
jgi:polyhydroxyalkanoate synthesis regulator phasin